MTVLSPNSLNTINCLYIWKQLDNIMTNSGHRSCFFALLSIGVMSIGAPKRGLGANDDVLITVSTISSLLCYNKFAVIRFEYA